MEWVQPSSICNMLMVSFKCFFQVISLVDRVSLSIVDFVEKEECYNFQGYLKDVRDDVGSTSFLCFFLGLLYKLFLNLSFECNLA